MHDGGLLGSKLLDFVPGTNFHVLQIISIIIIKRGINITSLHFSYTSTYKLNYMYWNCFFLPPLAVPLLIMTVTQAKWVAVFFCRNRAQI